MKIGVGELVATCPRVSAIRWIPIATIAFVPSVANAQAAVEPHALRWDPPVDIALTAVGAATWLSMELLRGDLAPAHCHACGVDSVDLNVRDTLVWRDPQVADTISTVTGFYLMPIFAVGLDMLAAAHDGGAEDAPQDALFVLEAAVVAEDLTDVTKFVVGRERPLVHVLPDDQKRLTSSPSDNNLSFFSGHVSGAFAIAAASGTIGAMRGYRWAAASWISGGLLAATTAYLRIAADKHWLTDVLVGALIGAGIGFAVPFVFHSAETSPPRSTLELTPLAKPAPPSVGLLSYAF
jgi:membrane-associated phospholipid phosphatase